jgi:transposase-like protein
LPLEKRTAWSAERGPDGAGRHASPGNLALCSWELLVTGRRMELPGTKRVIVQMEDRLRQIDELVTAFRRTRFPRGIECPRCLGNEVQKWGGFSGRRRYRCMSCGRTFSDLTGTPAAYLKKVECLPSYAACLGQSLSVRVAARAVGVAPTTAFRWRHRLLGGLEIKHPEMVGGWIEISSRRVPASCKGQRGLARPARRRGPSPSSMPVPRTSIVIAVDRYAGLVTASISNQKVAARELESAIGNRCLGGPTIVALEGRLGPAARFARRIGGSFRDARNPRSVDQIPAARAYGQELLDWMERFHGVATKYLPNYLSWHRTLTYARRHGLGETVLRWPTVSINNSREQSAKGIGAGGAAGTAPGMGSFLYSHGPRALMSTPSASNRGGP